MGQLARKPRFHLLGVWVSWKSRLATDLPTWATVSAGGMASLMVPEGVQQVVIFADRDESGTGQMAAERLATRIYDEGRRVKIILPPQVGIDWADIVAKEIRL